MSLDVETYFRIHFFFEARGFRGPLHQERSREKSFIFPPALCAEMLPISEAHAVHFSVSDWS